MSPTRLIVIVLVLGLATLSSPPARAGQEPTTPRTARPVPPSPGGSAAKLPVRRVLLYKNGIGYFEHVGRVHDNDAIAIDLTSGQLDDVLKSLTTVDLGSGRVTGITFDSSAPLEQRLRTLALPLGVDTTPLDVLHALRGARVDVQAGGTSVSGRVLSVQERTVTDAGRTHTVLELALVTDAGAVRTFDVRPGVAVRLAEGDMRRELTRYLDLVGSGRAQDVRRLVVSTEGTGARDLFVSYVSEVPVWKTTYRLVVPADATRKPFLQGWAIVDNTLGEDWTDVELSLVAGAPQSFVQQLSQPLYTRRPVVPLPSAALLTPQTHDATMAAADVAQQAARKRGVEGGIPGGALGGVVGGLPSPAPPPPAPAFSATMAEQVATRVAESTPDASGGDLGELFEYKLARPITVRRNQSALVPILQSDVTIDRVSLWNPSSGSARPLRALWITNDTGLTLDGGSLTLVEAGAFAGEGLLEAIAPKERRLVSYAVDLAGRVTVGRDGGPRRISRMRIARGALTQVSEERATSTYTLRNEDAAPRAFVIEHPRRDGWQVVPGGPTPVETTPAYQRFRVVVPGGGSETLKVEDRRELESRVAVTTITQDQVALILRGRGVGAEAQAQLQGIMTLAAEVSRLQAGVRDRRAEIERIEKDQARVRENLTALKNSAEERQLVTRYARQLDTQEDRLVVLRREIEELEAQRGTAQDDLVRRASALSLDAEL